MAQIHTVTLLPANVTFECSEEETILEAASRRGFTLPFGCRKGNCGTCKAQVLDGDVDLDIDSAYTLSDFERQQGFTLLCSAYPLCNSTVEMEGLDASDLEEASTPVGQYDAEVIRVRPLTEDIRELTLALNGDLTFRSGQFALLSATGSDVTRSYSMASPSSQRDRLTFMIKLVPGGEFSSRLERFEPGDKLGIEGPHGAFWIRDTSRPLLLVGGGAGMAPLWGMLQELGEREETRPVRFFYGARTSADLFHLDEIASVGERIADFQFVPALSNAGSDGVNGYQQGLVTDVLKNVLGPDLRSYDAYLCGPPPMIDSALSLLDRYGLEVRKNIFYDKFTAS